MYSEEAQNKIRSIVRWALLEQDARTYNSLPGDNSTGELAEETTAKIMEVINVE